MDLRIEFAFWILDLTILFIVGCNKLTCHILKGKVGEKLLNLIDIISILPIIPIYWARRQQLDIENSRGITFYIAIFFSIALIILLMRTTYLYNKEVNELDKYTN